MSFHLWVWFCPKKWHTPCYCYFSGKMNAILWMSRSLFRFKPMYTALGLIGFGITGTPPFLNKPMPYSWSQIPMISPCYHYITMKMPIISPIKSTVYHQFWLPIKSPRYHHFTTLRENPTSLPQFAPTHCAAPPANRWPPGHTCHRPAAATTVRYSW